MSGLICDSTFEEHWCLKCFLIVWQSVVPWVNSQLLHILKKRLFYSWALFMKSHLTSAYSKFSVQNTPKKDLNMFKICTQTYPTPPPPKKKIILTIYKVDFFMEIETLATCFKDMYHIYNFYNNFKKIWDNKVNLISGPVNIPVHVYVHAPDSVCIYLKSDG